MKVTYLAVAETAKLIRAALKSAFPGVKFAVRSSSYSGGCSVSVRWSDGPLARDVEAIAGAFQGKRFDGMIDLAYSAELWLLPDGTATVASDPGTVDNGGSRQPEREWMPHPEAKLIHTGAYVFCQREISPALKERAAAWVGRRDWQFLDSYGVHRAYDEAEAVQGIAHRAMLVDGALVIARRG